MSDQPTPISDAGAEAPRSNLPQAARRKTRWPNLIWIMPVIALLIVIYLAVQWFAERGEVVTVTFDHAGNARAGETKVMYQGVEAGHLIKIDPNKDGRRLDFKLRLIPEAKPGLNSNARFYLIGASPNFDLSSLRAVVTGVAVGYSPGVGGKPEDHFEGLDHAPIVLPGDRGTRYVLSAQSLGPIREGATLLYRGDPIGRVIDAQFTDQARFRLEIFVFDPFDKLVKPGVRFWRSSPLRLAFAGSGINASLAPLSTIFSGGVELDTATAVPNAQQSAAESAFTLYPSLLAARQGLSGPTVRYAFNFTTAAGDLEEGSAVTLFGFDIGEVETARLAYEQGSRKPYTAVTALIYPLQLDATMKAAAPGDWQAATDAKLLQLLRLGYRARLDQSPPLVGARSITLVQTQRAGKAELIEEGTMRRIPSAGGAGFEDIGTQADALLTKLNSVPIEQIGEDLRAITHRVRLVADSPKVDDAIQHLDNSLAQLDQMLTQVQPQMGPLITSLNQAAAQISGIATAAKQLLDGEGAIQDGSVPEAVRQLNEAARSVRTLADFLDRHPEALLRGKKSTP